jgi:hypothetical protein
MPNTKRLMSESVSHLQAIYIATVTDSVFRLEAASAFHSSYQATGHVPTLEAAILQLRKALEAIALASIAPNKIQYELFRAKAEEQTDYTKDYHASKILRVLGKINKNFYPLPLLPAIQQANGTLHFGRKATGYLTKKKFESIYDRLGRHMHANNPWGTNKNLQNLATELTEILSECFSLLALHATFIQSPEFTGVWIIEAARDASSARIITGEAFGNFIVEGS